MLQAFPVMLSKPDRAIVIEQQIHLYTPVRSVDKGLDKTIHHATGLDQVHLQKYALPGRRDRRQHFGQEVRPVDQENEAVAFTPRILVLGWIIRQTAHSPEI